MKKAVADLEEELSHVPLPIRGAIPSWLSGTLIRNGPVNISVDGEHNAHWFDGLAMLHAFTFDHGKVHYSNKFLRTDAYRTVFQQGSIHYDGFAMDPCKSLFKRLFTWLVPTENKHIPNANINVSQLAQEFVALTETPLPVRFDPYTLETLGVFDYEDKLPHNRCWESAHPHLDGYLHETINYLIEYGRSSYYTLYHIAKNSNERKVIARLPVQEPAYMHSFALTDNYIVLTEFPLVVKPLDLITQGKAFIHNFHWKKELGTRFNVIDRHAGKLAYTTTAKPFFAFHHVNAFETEEGLYLDIVCYDDPSIISQEADYFRRDTPPEISPMRLERFFISSQTQPITSEILFEGYFEFPRINSLFDGYPYRYIYMADPREGLGLRPIYKADTYTKKTQQWSEMGCYPGEPIFIPSPTASKEDDGLIATVVIQKKSAFLLILDANTFQEVARAHVPHPIPAGLHGQFFPKNGMH